MKRIIIDVTKCEECPYLQMHIIDNMNCCVCEKTGKVLFTQEDILYDSDSATIKTPIDDKIHENCPLEDV